MVKKAEVSLTRRAAFRPPSAPVKAIGSAAYVFMNVATNAPRVANGARNAEGMRSMRAPSRTRSMSSQSGL
ncbi:MAG TPA: hypothetical protein PLZ20_04185, partial [Nitrospira sp.]|nr:hypothetical protein [Nitrospira sp.]